METLSRIVHSHPRIDIYISDNKIDTLTSASGARYKKKQKYPSCVNRSIDEKKKKKAERKKENTPFVFLRLPCRK